MRRLPVVSVALAAGALAVAACGGSTPGASNLPTVPPVTVPSIAIPSIAIPTLPTGSGDTGLHADPELEARYPASMDGQPVGGKVSYRLADLVPLLAADHPERASAFLSALVGAGLDPNSMTTGSATYTVNDSSVSLDSVHTPGADASKFVALWPQLSQLDNPDSPLPTVTTQSIGGKNVTVMTEDSGDVTYIYPQGDVVWSFEPDDPDQAAKVIAALP